MLVGLAISIGRGGSRIAWGMKTSLRTRRLLTKRRCYDEIRVTFLYDERHRDTRDPSFPRQLDIHFQGVNLELWMARANDDEWSLDEMRGQYLVFGSFSPLIVLQTPTLDSPNKSEVEVGDAEHENQILVDNSLSDC